MPLLAPKSSVNAATAYSFDSSPSHLEPAEIEMLVREDENGLRIPRDGRAASFTRRRRLCLACLIILAIAIGIAVAAVVVSGRDDNGETAKVNTQGSSPQNQDDNTMIETPPPTALPVAPPPTDSPTARPTPFPTYKPSAAAVVVQPTGAPPTEAPTRAPTVEPTPFPTISPVAQPTLSPTISPVAEPTLSPTAAPIIAPTILPTASPTVPPTTPPPTASPTALVTTSEPTIDTQDDDYFDWYDATVTLNSGPMFEVIEQLPHESSAFTQGLTFANGRLFESTGLNGQSSVRELDPNTGDILVSVPLEYQFFGEGLAYANDKLIQITWKKATAFVYDPNDLTIPPAMYTYQTTKRDEGWGITHDPEKNELIVSDGSANLIFWDPDSLQTLRTVSVKRQNGSPALNLNELEFWRGRVLANVWYQDVLLVIHPETGVVEKEYDFSTLWPSNERPTGTDVFNGISISDDPDILYVTGKRWNRMYKVKLLP